MVMKTTAPWKMFVMCYGKAAGPKMNLYYNYNRVKMVHGRKARRIRNEMLILITLAR